MQHLEKLKPLALFVLRISLGIIFIFHGYPKLFGDPARAMASFTKMGFPTYFAYISGVLEVFGGTLLILGLFTRVTSLLLAIEMGIALARVHLPQAGIFRVAGYELPFLLGAASLALAATGAGLISIDHFTFETARKAPRKSKHKD